MKFSAFVDYLYATLLMKNVAVKFQQFCCVGDQICEKLSLPVACQLSRLAREEGRRRAPNNTEVEK